MSVPLGMLLILYISICRAKNTPGARRCLMVGKAGMGPVVPYEARVCEMGLGALDT